MNYCCQKIAAKAAIASKDISSLEQRQSTGVAAPEIVRSPHSFGGWQRFDPMGFEKIVIVDGKIVIKVPDEVTRGGTITLKSGALF